MEEFKVRLKKLNIDSLEYLGSLLELDELLLESELIDEIAESLFSGELDEIELLLEEESN